MKIPNSLNKLLLISALLFLGLGCAQSQNQVKASKPLPSVETSSLPDSFLDENHVNHETSFSNLETDPQNLKKEKSKDYFFEGQLCELKKDLNCAFLAYKNALSLDSNNSELLTLLAQMSAKLELWPQAEIYLNKRLERVTQGDSLRSSEYPLAGEIFMQVQKPGQAVPYYEKSFEVNEDLETGFLLVSIYEQLGKMPKQAEFLDKLLPQMGYPEVWVNKAARLHHTMGNISAIVKLYQSSWKNTSNRVYAEKLGQLYETLGMYQNFHDFFDTLYRADTSNEYNHLQYARSLVYLGQNANALPHFKELNQNNPDNDNISFTYATLLYSDKKYEEALSKLILLSDSNSSRPQYSLYIGSIYEALKQDSLAEKYFRQASTQDTSQPDYIAHLCRYYLRQGNLDQAQNQIEFLNSKFPNNPVSIYFRASLAKSRGLKLNDDRIHAENQKMSKEELGFFNEAEELLENLLKSKPNDLNYLFDLAVVKERKGSFSEAVKLFNEIIKQDSNHYVALNYLGYMLADAGTQLKKAGLLIDRALKIQPNSYAIMDSKGWWYFKNHKYIQAKEYLEKALKDSGDDVTILEHMALTLEKMGQKSEAKSIWAKILTIKPKHKKALKKSGLKD